MLSPNRDENKKLSWMYKGPNSLVNREDYLLGRSVDKTLEQLNAEEKEKKQGGSLVPPKNHVEHECIPPSIRDFNKIMQAEQVDLSAKLQEDPLVAIKKQEEEARRQFLQNPVQLKKLQKALKLQEEKRNKKKQHRSKKHDSDDSEEELNNKLLKILKGNLKVNNNKKSKTNALDTILMHKFNQLKDKLSEEDLDDIIKGALSEDETNEESVKKKSKTNKKECKKSHRDPEKKVKSNRIRPRSSSSSSEDKKYHKNPRKNYNSDQDNKKVTPQNWGLVKSDGTKIPLKRKVEPSCSSRRDSQKQVTPSNSSSTFECKRRAKKLTEEQKDTIRKEMMRNAQWRDKERSENVRKYRENDRKEEEASKEKFNDKFVHRELLKSANTASVESRIKANRNHIQRSSRHMEANFSRRN